MKGIRYNERTGDFETVETEIKIYDEERIRKEAYLLMDQLDENLYDKKYLILGTIGGFIGLLTGIIIIDRNKPGFIPLYLVSFCIGFLAFWYPIRIYVFFKGKANKRNWKRNHPNDARSKYL